MEEREIKGFNLMVLLFVTSFCFTSFAQVLRMLDGVDMKFFLRIGFITFVSGVFIGLCVLIDKKTEHRSDF
jgi:hypothetical protein